MSVRRLVLASQSPRRRQILTISGYEFDILPSQISEIPDENLNLTSQIRQLASDKAEACLKMGKYAEGQGILVLASDTVVVFADQILGKPKDEKEARSFLGRLSGQTHDVITAVSLIDVDTGRRVQDHAVTHVRFRLLSTEAIDAYVATGDPFDKAGGYGIQNALAANFIESFDGDYDTVVGLSMKSVEKCFRELGVSPRRRGRASSTKATVPNASASTPSETYETVIAENVKRVRAEIARAALAPDRATFVGCSHKPARLVAVSKTKPAMDVIDAWLAGQRIFAENYVQEALPKIAEVDELLKLAGAQIQFSAGQTARSADEIIEWHFIGALQSKKVKQVVGAFSLIHSVDRVSLVEEIEKRALVFQAESAPDFQDASTSRLISSVSSKSSEVSSVIPSRAVPHFAQRILLQINIADESSKGGASREEFFELFDAAMKCPHIRVCGVMALPPLTDDVALARKRFAEVRALFEEARGRLPKTRSSRDSGEQESGSEASADLAGKSPTTRADFVELSMGTTHDFAEAIAEGATLVRIGTALFGARA